MAGGSGGDVADVQGSYAQHVTACAIEPPGFAGSTGVAAQIADCFSDLIRLPAR